MNQLAFTAEVIKALAWPIFLGIIVWYFRNPLYALLERIVSLKLGGWEANFTAQAIEVAEVISQSNQRALSHAEPDDEIFSLAKNSPRSAIIEASVKIEATLRKLANEHAIANVENRPPGQLIRNLQGQGAISPETAQTLQGLFVMRNLAVNSTETQLTTARAVEFVTLANAIQYLLNRAT